MSPSLSTGRAVRAGPRVAALPAVAALALAVSACASTPPPVAELASARTAISSAESAGALQQAPGDFAAAREKLGKAEVANKDKKYVEARGYAEEATADATVAEAKTRAAKSVRAAEELRRANGTLSNEINGDAARGGAVAPSGVR